MQSRLSLAVAGFGLMLTSEMVGGPLIKMEADSLFPSSLPSFAVTKQLTSDPVLKALATKVSPTPAGLVSTVQLIEEASECPSASL